MELVVHRSESEVADAAATLIADAVSASTDRFSLGLAGGSTPRSTYLNLRDHAIDWSRVDAWLSDERWVATDSDRSNGHMATTTLLHETAAILHRPRWDPDLDPAESASAYDRFLRELHAVREGPDLVLLGLGTDGHTASLFPGSPALLESDRWYVANVIPGTGEIRLTATYPLLRSASLIVFLVMGDAKAEALHASLDGLTPAGRVRSDRGRVLWYVDEEAASLVV